MDVVQEDVSSLKASRTKTDKHQGMIAGYFLELVYNFSLVARKSVLRISGQASLK